eukprot:m.95611 g.95611  ORF g.95611 m.95611 type:complete len:57 (+) comp8953_c1_seq3:783-953(+)
MLCHLCDFVFVIPTSPFQPPLLNIHGHHWYYFRKEIKATAGLAKQESDQVNRPISK